MAEALTPRKQPKQARSKATVDAILEAGARVLVEEGYDKASTNRVAKVAGVSVGSLYQYFPNKDALFVALLEAHTDEMLGQLEETVERLLTAPVREAVHSYIEGMVRAHQIEPELHQQLTLLLPRLTTVTDIVDIHQRAEGAVRLWLQAHREELAVADLDLAAFLLVTTVEAATHAALIERPGSLDDGSFAEELTSLVLRYLGVA